MILIGESINIMSHTIGPAMREKDAKPIQQMAVIQEEKGANYLEINLGPAKKQGDEIMEWLVKTVEEVTELPLTLDTTNPVAMEAGLKVVTKARALINSASGQSERLAQMLPLAKKYDADVIGLLLTNEGMPRDVNERVKVALEIVAKASELGIGNENIWIDPLMFTITVGQDQVVSMVEFLQMLPDLFVPPTRSTCGLSNVSQGAPEELRSLLNQAIYCILEPTGIHSAIVNVLDEDFMAVVNGISKQGSPEAYINGLDGEAQTKLNKTIAVLKKEALYCHSWLEM
ncbi:dihydropteroate synthase [bacterium]|nr:dihydropteroate synthase [bacterium]MBU1615744.1 dihydropteroate synthase [bacterium]